jgi:N-acetylglutamate synthase/N-acetylornithine aminotransferase
VGYSRDQVMRAGVETAQLELEHGSDFENILARSGVAVVHVGEAAQASARSMVERWSAKNPDTSQEEQALMFGAALTGFIRGFATAEQLRRATPDS